MSYKEKRTIVSIVTGVLVLAGYCIYAFGQYQSGAAAPGDLKFWAGAILTFIGIGIVANIIIQIIFHILFSVSIAVKKKVQDESFADKDIEKSIDAEIIEDEMDKLIEMKSMKISFFVAGAGFIAGLVLLALDYSPAGMLNMLFISFSGGSLLEGITQLYFYRKGVNHG